MSTVDTLKIVGDLSVVRNVAIGGSETVSGDIHVGHNLKVDGWIDAENIKSGHKGIFKTEADLKSAYPSPKVGWCAGVGASSPFALYVESNGQWAATGGTVAVDMIKGDPAYVESQHYDASGNTVLEWNNGTTSTINKGGPADFPKELLPNELLDQMDLKLYVYSETKKKAYKLTIAQLITLLGR